MRKAKLKQDKKSKLNNRLAVEGRTKIQRKNKKMKSAVDNYDGRLGALKGKTFRDQYSHMHRLIANDRAEQRRLEEEKLQEGV